MKKKLISLSVELGSINFLAFQKAREIFKLQRVFNVKLILHIRFLKTKTKKQKLNNTSHNTLTMQRLLATQSVATSGILSRVFLFHFEKISGNFSLFQDVLVNTG